MVQFHTEQVSHSEFHPIQIKLQVTFHKEIAVH